MVSKKDLDQLVQEYNFRIKKFDRESLVSQWGYTYLDEKLGRDKQTRQNEGENNSGIR